MAKVQPIADGVGGNGSAGGGAVLAGDGGAGGNGGLSGVDVTGAAANDGNGGVGAGLIFGIDGAPGQPIAVPLQPAM